MGDDPYDVLIIGAGLSGIGVAAHLALACPKKRVGIIERRQAVGGTWDLFRYPGIRSDSDMVTFGYKLRPWTDSRMLADGPSIRAYVAATAKHFGIDRNIRFGIKTTNMDWSSAERRWTVTGVQEASGEPRRFKAKFLVAATGYYNYDKGYLPDFPGVDDFKGRCIHPQSWPDDLDYQGKRVVVIGSGATAVTLIPALADDTAHITMLQRSPSYIHSVPAVDTMAVMLGRILPESWTYAVARKRNIFLARFLYKLSRRFPGTVRKLLLRGARKQLGPDFDMTHFSPKYEPWDERLCVVPDGDLFKAIRAGKASVVTGHIERFIENGILLKSGQELEADIIITATGLDLQTLGGSRLAIDGEPVETCDKVTYKAVLVQDVPNMATIFGYTNISWTLKVDLAAEYLCRLLGEMDERGVDVVTPRAPQGEAEDHSVMSSLKAGYVRRGDAVLPRQGRTGPWHVSHKLESDEAMYRRPIDDAALEWSAPA